MNFSDITTWMNNNTPILIIALLILVYLSYNSFLRFRAKQQTKEPEQAIKFPATNIDYERTFSDVPSMESSNLDYLNKMLEYTDKELQEKKSMYLLAQKQHKELLVAEEKLYKYIPILMKQKDIIQQQINVLNKRGLNLASNEGT
jgi:hypothetical protein